MQKGKFEKKEKERLLEKVVKLKKLFEDGSIPRLHKHEVNPGLAKGDRLNYLYFTLPVSINFQRSSPAMWISALKTFEDPETNYVFFPEKVVLESRERIQKDLMKHKLALQKNKHIDIWIKICGTLNKYYLNDPRKILEESENDVEKILNIVRKVRKKDFPYLSGGKICNFWLYILTVFTDVKFKNPGSISIIPDTHVIQASKILGITNEKDKPDKVAEKWFELLSGSEIIPMDIHPVLWNWSRAKFEPKV